MKSTDLKPQNRFGKGKSVPSGALRRKSVQTLWLAKAESPTPATVQLRSAELDWENISFPQISFAFDNTLQSACAIVRPGADRLIIDN